MPKFLLLVFVGILLSGCYNAERYYPMHNKNDINEIVKAVITQQATALKYDTTGRLFNNPLAMMIDNLTLNIDLGKPDVSHPELMYFGFKIDKLFDTSYPHRFKKDDLRYLEFQLRTVTDFKIDTAVMPKMKFTSDAERKLKSRKETGRFYFYKMSMPLFSVDQKQAYIMLSTYYNYMAGAGYAFILKKINGKWRIVWQNYTWMS